MNQCQLIGFLGKDVDIRFTKTGKAITNMSLGVSRYSKDGEESKTDWIYVTAWDKKAEWCGENLHKGDKVFVSGRLETGSYQKEDGTKRYTWGVLANTICQCVHEKKQDSSFDQYGQPDEESIPF